VEEFSNRRLSQAELLQVLDSTLRLHGSEGGGDYFLGGFYSVAEVWGMRKQWVPVHAAWRRVLHVAAFQRLEPCGITSAPDPTSAHGCPPALQVYTTGFVQRGLATLKDYRGVDLAELVKEAGADRCAGHQAG